MRNKNKLKQINKVTLLEKGLRVGSGIQFQQEICICLTKHPLIFHFCSISVAENPLILQITARFECFGRDCAARVLGIHF